MVQAHGTPLQVYLQFFYDHFNGYITYFSFFRLLVSVQFLTRKGILAGHATLNMPAGAHRVEVQWRRIGTVFQGWVSSPSSLDGFACSRNVYVLQEKFDTPTYVDHKRQVLPGTASWYTVGNKVFFIINCCSVSLQLQFHVLTRLLLMVIIITLKNN